jgi:hypothetical protein
VANCRTQQEIDEVWEKLSEGAKKFSAPGLETNSACRGRSLGVLVEARRLGYEAPDMSRLYPTF